MRLWPLVIISAVASPAAAEFRLGWPVDCTLGQDCFLQQYVDRDPGPDAVDFTGGPLSYDGHEGTDIRVPDLADMGMAVVAAASGTVRATRDGVDDAYLTPERRAALQGRGCGNGVVIDHADGWQTQYCHLLKGSVAVRTGEAVAEGDKLGEIGLSGFTEFPHVDFMVRKDGQILDPFDAGPVDDGRQDSLWQVTPTYQPGGLLEIGFSDRVPNWDDVKDGKAGLPGLAPRGNAMVGWVYFFGSRAGDTLSMAIAGPDGTPVFAQELSLDRTQAQAFRAGGRRTPATGWAVGAYTFTAALIRDGVTVEQRSVTVPVE